MTVEQYRAVLDTNLTAMLRLADELRAIHGGDDRCPKRALCDRCAPLAARQRVLASGISSAMSELPPRARRRALRRLLVWTLLLDAPRWLRRLVLGRWAGR